MNERINGRLEDASIAARHIRGWVDGSSRDDLEHNVMLQSAVLLQLERIGEALRTVRDRDEAIEQKFPEIHGWIAMRYLSSHAYREIDLDAVWFTCNEEIPELIRTLAGLLE